METSQESFKRNVYNRVAEPCDTRALALLEQFILREKEPQHSQVIAFNPLDVKQNYLGRFLSSPKESVKAKACNAQILRMQYYVD